ncbi:LysR family transcriptional regulator (plasmid) [Nostoc sp. C057]|uniref:LysR family transcriptional regulator n=1 Tax=Nostoc sp. C057 TaxID=2576903 RepID=UPI0015C3535D|nr:LysR substrate-binding domain-containing protein [Nostoc sp. C057]QLE53754.1 LysR family transcriptional regulator [Nostoc sp. C057]
MALGREHNFELQHLRYFIAVAEKENCSISEVAEELHMAQSNLSQQIKDLEKKLGNVTLFERKKHPLRLTVAGLEFLKEARLILAQVDRAIETATLASQGQIGRLIVGFNSSVSNSVLPDILIAFRTRFPLVKLVLQERTAYSLIKGLETQQIDIGLMHWSALNRQDIGLCVEPIKEESLVLVLPSSHPLAAQTEISLQSLANESFILPPSHLSYSLYQQIVSLCQQIGFVPKVTQEATLMLTILRWYWSVAVVKTSTDKASF